MKQNILHILNFYLRFFLFQSKRLFLLLLIGTPLLLSAATTSVTNATPSAITDNSCFDRTFMVPIGSATINDVTISVDLVHNYRGALHLYLTSPTSTQIELITYQGNNSATNLHVLFTDAGTTSILSDTSNHTSIVTRSPATALSTFDTENPQGTWTLRVCDDDAFGDTGTFNTATLNIDYTLPNLPPTADAGTNQTASFGTNISLNGIGSDTDGTISSYLWQEGATTLSSSANFSKNDFTVGAHTLTFTVTDNDGAIATDTVTITVVSNLPPLADAGVDQTINIGDSVTLNANGSSDSDGNITDYNWYEGGTFIGSGINITLPSLTGGTHTFTLTVTDDEGATDSDIINVRVNTPPIANAGADQNITLGDTVTLDGSGSTDDNVSSLVYHWTEASIPVDENSVSPTITISTAGTYTITLTVTDDNGLTSTDEVVIRVNTPPITEDLNLTILKNTTLSVELNATDADGDTIVSYSAANGPFHGTLSLIDNNLTYTPDTDYIGTDSFTYRAFDGISYSVPSDVNITIIDVATANRDDYNTTYFTQFSAPSVNPVRVGVLHNDTGFNIRITHFTSTTHGTLAFIPEDGSFDYTPNEYFDGNDSFEYTIEDDLNNTSTTTVHIVVHPPRSDLSIIKSAPSSTIANTLIDYTLSISSAHDEAYILADNIRVTDTLPAGVQFDSIIAPTGWTCGYVSPSVTCDATQLAPGYSGVITIRVYAPNVLGQSSNTATITSDVLDPNLLNNSSTAITIVTGPDVDLVMTKTASTSTPTTSSSYTYTLSVSNEGDDPAANVEITDILDNNLGFININDGADWSCSQGSTINCNYIPNNGTMLANSGSNDIIITVRAPATTGVIPNNATATSDALEVNTLNNTDDVNVTIIPGSDDSGDTPFEKFLQFNLYGDMKLIGNVNIWKPGSSEPGSSANNNNFTMTFQDVDSDNTTYNSSWANLALGNPNYEIEWAGLYWLGHICDTGGCDNDSSRGGNYLTRTSNKGKIRFKAPGETSYTDITATSVNSVIDNSNGTQMLYQGFKDVTSLMKGQGKYYVANLRTSEGEIARWGGFGGWALQVVYRDPSRTLHYKNVSIFNGFRVVNGGTIDVNVDGFLTPRTGKPINASLAFFAGDGDAGSISGDILKMLNKNTGAMEEVKDSLNDTGSAKPEGGGIFNGSMTELGSYYNDRSNPHKNNLGIDIDRMDVKDFMDNSQSNTRFRFTSGNDIHTINHIAFATDLTTPIIDGFIKEATILHSDGTSTPAGPSASIYPGDILEYNIRFKNSGDEVAENVEIFDDFDFDGLTPALDIEHFDTTKLKLFKGNQTSTPVASPDCAYNNGERRVYCKIASIAIGDEYIMQFQVRVKENLSESLFDSNASNTAYAKYRNPNGNTNVERTTTPAGEKVGGKSNSLNAGIFRKFEDYPDIFIKFTAINAGYNYNQDQNITTKIVNKPFDLTVVHLNRNGIYSDYASYIDIPVLLTFAGEVTQPLNDPSNSYFTQGVDNILVTNLISTKAHRSKQIKLAFIDWATIASLTPSTSSCFPSNSADYLQSNNLKAMPACFHSYELVQDVFPKNRFPKIDICYGKDQNATPNYPCDAFSYTTEGQVKANITPEKYNHNYGCYQCVTDIYGKFTHDAEDRFALRPDRFGFSSNAGAYPDLLRSGLDYNITLIAFDGNSDNPQPTLDYNTSVHTLNPDIPVSIYPPTGTIPSTSLEGNATLSLDRTPSDENFENGQSNEVIPLTFDNVGRISAIISEQAWGFVDDDDTPKECNATLVSKYGVPVEATLSICGELNATFIPHHFNVTATLQNHRGGNFTYLSNEETFMSARITTTITAQNEQNGTTTNFKQSQYENPMIVDVNVTDWNTTLTSNLATLKPERYNGAQRLDTDIDVTDLNSTGTSQSLLGFGTDGEANGTHIIGVMDTNTSQRLFFNYRRDINAPKNPFVIDGNETNISVQSTYTSTRGAADGTAIIKGTIVANGNATFVYARAHPSKYLYDNITSASVKTPIMIQTYCDQWPASAVNCPAVDTNTPSRERRWFMATAHRMALGDGNVTLSATNGTVSPSVVSINLGDDGTDGSITVSGTAPDIVDIDFVTTNPTDTSLWLIYNKDTNSLPSPFYRVRFLGTSGWTGEGKTGHVVGDDINTKKSRRLGW